MGGTICRTLNHLPPQTICNLLFGIWSAPLRQVTPLVSGVSGVRKNQ
jgi:hypothetical protein